MKKQISILILVCASLISEAQTNFVKNPSFEQYDTCPYQEAQITFSKNWQNTVTPNFVRGASYYNSCAGSNIYTGCPINAAFYQKPHYGNGMSGTTFYYDKTPPAPPPPSPYDNRLYIQGFLDKTLSVGKTYCVSFWVNLMEASGYAHNMIGAYLDDGSINSAVDSAGEAIYSVTPQIYSISVLSDTLNWIKVEGSFIAKGNENYITIGNFATDAATTKVITNYWLTFESQSAYLIDDVSVIPIDLPADAGKDTWVEVGKQVQIGRVGDTTAQGLDCKWYKKGALIDSGAIITVNANSIINAIDTYVVVQNICGVIKRDTVNVKTTNVGIKELSFENAFSIYPNPSNGDISIKSFVFLKETISAKVYDLLGRVVHQEPLNFSNKEATLKLSVPSGSYILELKDEAGNVQRERIVIN
jgi:hypothetical protein